MDTSLHKFVYSIPDPRVRNRSHHLLSDIVIITIIAIICGAGSWDSIELFGKSKEPFLRQFLRLPNGIPSHDTFNRVISKIRPEKFHSFFINWAASLKSADIKKEVIAIDGKTIRRSHDSFHNTPAVHIVSAWANSNSLTLGQIETASKSNEITAIPALLDLLDIEGSIITIDAMGCQKDIAKKIVESKADYIFGLKGNQKTIREEVECSFAMKEPNSFDEQIDKGHGRIETRKCYVINDLKSISKRQDWEGLNSIIKIESTREINDKITTEYRFYISSCKDDAATFNSNIRQHWGVENSLHWVLDMTFNEDYQRKRKNSAAVNFAVLQKMAHNILKQDKSKGSIKGKRLRAGWDDIFLKKLLKF